MTDLQTEIVNNWIRQVAEHTPPEELAKWTAELSKIELTAQSVVELKVGYQIEDNSFHASISGKISGSQLTEKKTAKTWDVIVRELTQKINATQLDEWCALCEHTASYTLPLRVGCLPVMRVADWVMWTITLKTSNFVASKTQA